MTHVFTTADTESFYYYLYIFMGDQRSDGFKFRALDKMCILESSFIYALNHLFELTQRSNSNMVTLKGLGNRIFKANGSPLDSDKGYTVYLQLCKP